MGLAKLALIFSAALAMAVTAVTAGEAAAGGRSGRGHGHSGAAHRPLYNPGPSDPYWYYCRAANTYYPYVQSCPGGWERYLPSPQPHLG